MNKKIYLTEDGDFCVDLGFGYGLYKSNGELIRECTLLEYNANKKGLELLCDNKHLMKVLQLPYDNKFPKWTFIMSTLQYFDNGNRTFDIFASLNYLGNMQYRYVVVYNKNDINSEQLCSFSDSTKKIKTITPLNFDVKYRSNMYNRIVFLEEISEIVTLSDFYVNYSINKSFNSYQNGIILSLSELNTFNEKIFEIYGK